ncbi:hypothetical protein OIB37_13805 [Streptomyces sp. NBC_00820]|uniref:hypothetical protein n=1 Tax=Streptomyces sp. NBC_00820 TaxID=2975842 RepID=UPI002ED3B408|nr:hypothetical protein OIB37_13805 [Streptomyces sp. NBC_00820]
MALVDDLKGRKDEKGQDGQEGQGGQGGQKEAGRNRQGPRAPHPLRTEALRSFAPWAGAAVLLVLVVMLAGTTKRWQGGWGETTGQLQAGLVIAVPLAAAAGCWQGGRERRQRTEELWATFARGPLARLLTSALPVVVWVMAGYLAAAALGLLATWPYAQGDRPHLALLPSGAVAVGAAALTGHVVGRLVPSRLAAPVLALVGYVGLGYTAHSSDLGRYLSPAFENGATSVPVWWQPVATTVWTGGLAGAAVLAYAARRRYTALLPLAAATAAGALLIQNGVGLWHHNTTADHQVCDTSVTPAVCVNARYAGMLPQVTEALSGITGRLKGVRHLPARWEDRPGAPRRDEVALPMLTPIGWYVVRGQLTDPEQFAWEAMVALQRGDCAHEPDPQVARVDEAVQNYLAPSPGRAQFDGLDARGSASHRADLKARQEARGHLAAMGDAQRRAWLSAYFATAGDCDPKVVPAL